MDNHTKENDPEHIWALIEKVKISIVVTHDGARLEGRPFQAYPDRDAGVIWYMTDRAGAAARQVDADERVFLSFADKGGNDYVTVTGTAMTLEDRAKVRELWTPWAEAFWDGPDDPRIVLIRVDPDQAHYWDAPNGIAATVAMLASAVTGQPPKLGKSGRATL